MEPNVTTCRLCGGPVREFFDFGRQPLSNNLPSPQEVGDEFFFRLAVGLCTSCTMVQLVQEVPREKMFRQDYPYYSSGSARMREHFADTAREFLATELTGDDPFCVEIGCNDGVMLGVIKDAGVRHLGVEPSGGVVALAEAAGIRVRPEFFEESTASAIAESDGQADLIYAANTICHIPYLDSILDGVNTLLKPSGVFVFEDPYLGDIVEKNTFDQIYDEHFYLFTARSVQAAAQRLGLELVDVRRLDVHGGEVRYTIARAGARRPSPAVGTLLEQEATRGLAEYNVLAKLGAGIRRICQDLVALLVDLEKRGATVVGYGATAKSATVANYSGLTSALLPCVYDTTAAKIGRVMPGSHIPIRSAAEFHEPYPDYALLFAWNHAEEIMAREEQFSRQGGRWIVYVPEVGTLPV